jgi:transcriptional regulator with XRE-family HTH domain
MRGDRLKQLRLDKGLSQYDLADLIGSNQTQIKRWEKGEVVPSSDSLRRLAEFFGVTADYLLGLTDNPQGEISMSDLTEEEQQLILLSRSKVWGRFLELALGIFEGKK